LRAAYTTVNCAGHVQQHDVICLYGYSLQCLTTLCQVHGLCTSNDMTITMIGVNLEGSGRRLFKGITAWRY